MSDINHKIVVSEQMNKTKRKQVYRDLKQILTEVAVPGHCIEELSQMWRVQEELKQLEKVTGSVYKSE